jgi:V/A-type H+-transporting ATPase subunit E
MSNLDNLTEKILSDAKAKAKVVLDESERMKEEIVNSRVREAEGKKGRIMEKAASDASLMKDRVVSNAELKVRNESLRVKQEVIDRVFDLSKKNLMNLKEEEYLSYLKRTLATLDLKGTETLVVTRPMVEKVKLLGLPQSVSETEFTESGFNLKDKGIVMNYTFTDLVEYLRDELEAEVATTLFKV